MKKTIFHMIRSNVTGGAENVFLDYCKILKDEFELVCLTTDKFVHLEEIKKLGIQTKTLRFRGPYDFISVLKLFFLVKKHSPDLVVAHNGRAFRLMIFFNKMFKNINVKTVSISHGEEPNLMVKLDYIITVAKHLADKIKRDYKSFPSDNIFSIYNATKVNHSYDHSIKEKNDKFTLGTLSRLESGKNIITALKSFKIFLKDVPNAQFKIAGDGEDLEKLTNFVKKENLEDKVHFIGHVTNIEEFFNEIDICFIHLLVKGSA